MRKLTHITGAIMAASAPTISTIACAPRIEKQNLKEVDYDLKDIIKWFKTNDASKKNYEDILDIRVSAWTDFDNRIAIQLGQMVLPTISKETKLKYKLSSNKVSGKKVEFTIAFQAINKSEKSRSIEIKFLSNNIYSNPTGDEIDVEEIKNALGTPISLDNKLIKELDIQVDQSVSYWRFEEASIANLGLTNITIPAYLNNVELTYKLIEKERVIGQKSIYELEIRIMKNAAIAQIKLDLKSSDDAKYSDVEIERNRISSLLTNGKISSNISSSHLTWASMANINATQKPFNDNGTPIHGVTVKYYKTGHNDIDGEVNLQLTFEKQDERTVRSDVTLIGFLNYYSAEMNNVFINLGLPSINSSKTAAHLKNVVDTNSSIPKTFNNLAISNLGIQGMTIPSNLNGYSLNYVLYISSWEMGKNALFRMTLTLSKNGNSQSNDYFFYSSDTLSYDDANTEKNRILGLLSGGKIETNLQDANEFKASEYNLDSNTKPYYDIGTVPSYISATYSKIQSEDSIGEMTIRISISSSNDNSSATVDIILTGFFYIDPLHVDDVSAIKREFDNTVNPTNNKSFLTFHSKLTDVERSFNTVTISFFGLGATLPTDLLGVELTYTLAAIKEGPYELCEYNFTIYFRKGNYSTTSSVLVKSGTIVNSATRFEYERLMSVTFDKVKTNIHNAGNLLPSETTIGLYTKPFADPGTQTSNVTVKHIVNFVDDGRGVIGMTFEVSAPSQQTYEHSYMLTGFLNSHDVLNEYVEKVKNHFWSSITISKKNAPYLDAFLTKTGSYEELDFYSGVNAGGLPTSTHPCHVEFQLTKKYPMTGAESAWYDAEVRISLSGSYSKFNIRVRTYTVS